MTNTNKQQKLILEYFPKNRSLQTIAKTNATIVEVECNDMILSCDEPDTIIQCSKKRLFVETDGDLVCLTMDGPYL